MKQRQPKTIQNINQKSIHYSDTYINGETQTLKNKLNNKFHDKDIKFFKYRQENEKRCNQNGMSPAALTQNLLMDSEEKELIV